MWWDQEKALYKQAHWAHIGHMGQKGRKREALNRPNAQKSAQRGTQPQRAKEKYDLKPSKACCGQRLEENPPMKKVSPIEEISLIKDVYEGKNL